MHQRRGLSRCHLLHHHHQRHNRKDKEQMYGQTPPLKSYKIWLVFRYFTHASMCAYVRASKSLSEGRKKFNRHGANITSGGLMCFPVVYNTMTCIHSWEVLWKRKLKFVCSKIIIAQFNLVAFLRVFKSRSANGSLPVQEPLGTLATTLLYFQRGSHRACNTIFQKTDHM